MPQQRNIHRASGVTYVLKDGRWPTCASIGFTHPRVQSVHYSRDSRLGVETAHISTAQAGPLALPERLTQMHWARKLPLQIAERQLALSSVRSKDMH